jgi:serine/threonine protein kinase
VSDVRSNTFSVLKVLINNQPKAVELFQREAEVLKMLDHPGIPKVESNNYFIYFPRATQQQLHCLVMEKIEGIDLYEYWQQRDERPINEDLAVQWLKEIVKILQLIHDQKYFHRDIKPPNIMLRATGNLALIDFGAAREATQTYYFAHQQGNVTGVMSAGYTPNEQMNGQAVPQSDFFALGRTFVFLLTGKDPTKMYDPLNDQLNWRNHAEQISPRFADLIDQMMARLPSQRPADAREILQRLADMEQVVKPSRQTHQSYQPSSEPTVAYQSYPQVSQQSHQAYQQSYQSVKLAEPDQLYQPTPQVTIGWGFYRQWLLANVAVFITLGFVSSLNWIFYFTIGSVLLGTIQWLVLRRWVSWVPKTGWWVLVTALGLALGYFSRDFTFDAFQHLYKLPRQTTLGEYLDEFGGRITFLETAVWFFIIGGVQWLLLRRWVSNSFHWIWVNALGALVAGVVRLVIGEDTFFYFVPIRPGLVMGFSIYTAITGVALMRLLQNPISKA